ncbi:hypothetical protein N2152v2_005614 [Parachlorella kessleri]
MLLSGAYKLSQQAQGPGFLNSSRTKRGWNCYSSTSRPLQRSRSAAHSQQQQQQQQEVTELLTSLIPESLSLLDNDEELAALHARVQQEGQAALTREERQRRQRSLDNLGVPSFSQVLSKSGASPLRRSATKVLQINIGLFCNQACKHCHVESSPRRTEAMSREVAERCVALLRSAGNLSTLDITGGAPEFNPNFRYLVKAGRALGLDVIDRCNLTVLLEPGMEDLVDFLAEQGVHVVASLPCYSPTNVDAQRGKGVFERSIEGLQRLNAAGYGRPGSGLQLDLVYNPGGVFLAPPQSKLEPTYKQELKDAYGIEFNQLFCLNNMPIKRWADHLAKEGRLEEYMQVLVESFNPAAAEGLMCRDTLSVRYDGRLYDCDFNQQLDLGLPVVCGTSKHRGSGNGNGNGSGSRGRGAAMTVFDVESLDELMGRPIAVDNHCFGCTAGAGSGCQGATS